MAIAVICARVRMCMKFIMERCPMSLYSRIINTFERNDLVSTNLLQNTVTVDDRTPCRLFTQKVK